MPSTVKHIVTIKDLCLQLTHYNRKASCPDLLLLHGFLGSGEQFQHLFKSLSDFSNPVTVDIMPNTRMVSQDENKKGGTTQGPMYETSLLADGLQKAITHFIRPRPYILGYSMGARLALSWAVRYPGVAAGLILESGTAGIADPEQRKERRKLDWDRAEKIRSDYPSFLKEWQHNTLFSPQNRPDTDTRPEPSSSGPLIKKLADIQQQQNPDHMARWLTDFGTGSMPPLHGGLKTVTCPVLLITGASDPKFCTIADYMKHQFPDVRHITVPNAAHRVHIDTPDSYLTLIKNFILN